MGAKQEEEEAAKEKPLPNMKWRNGKITNTLKGNFLFCLIGTGAIKTEQYISAQLRSKELKTVWPIAGHMFVAKVQHASWTDLRRVRVVQVRGNMATVFAVDLGVLSTVDCDVIKELPPDLSLEEISPTASLVRLKG